MGCRDGRRENRRDWLSAPNGSDVGLFVCAMVCREQIGMINQILQMLGWLAALVRCQQTEIFKRCYLNWINLDGS